MHLTHRHQTHLDTDSLLQYSLLPSPPFGGTGTAQSGSTKTGSMTYKTKSHGKQTSTLATSNSSGTPLTKNEKTVDEILDEMDAEYRQLAKRP